MATTWPTMTTSEVLSGEGAKIVGQSLFDRTQALKRAKNTTCYFASGTFTNLTPFTTFKTIRYRVPEFARAGEFIRLYINAALSGAGPTAHYRINNGSTNGTDTSITSTTAAWYSSDLTIQSGWPGTIIDINLQGYLSVAGTLNYNVDDCAGNLQVTD